MVAPFLDAWQRFSRHCASHLSSVFIYSLVAPELNRSKRLTDQLLCEISLLIVVSLSVRRINMSEISGGRRVSVKHDCLKKSRRTLSFFCWTMGAAELIQRSSDGHSGTTSKWCASPKIWANHLNEYLSCEKVFQKVHFGKSSSHTCTLKVGFDADVLCKWSYLFTQPWSRIYLSPTNPYGEAWSKPRMLAASHRAGWWGLSRLLLYVLWSLFSYWSMSSKAAPWLWLYGVKGPPSPGSDIMRVSVLHMICSSLKQDTWNSTGLNQNNSTGLSLHTVQLHLGQQRC